MTLQIGDQAPDFSATSSDGRAIALADYRGKKNVVLYFYPKDFTSVCTKETCGFRDLIGALGDEHTEIIGVSADSDDSHEKFRDAYQVPFPLLTDRDKHIGRAYEVWGGLGSLLGMVKRVTFVIDKQGRIADRLEGAFSAATHVDGAKAALLRLQAAESQNPA